MVYNKNIKKWMFYMFIMLFIVCLPLSAKADPVTERNNRVRIVFLNETETGTLRTISSRYGNTISIPTINDSYLPDDYPEDGSKVPCWVLQQTGGVYYPSESFKIEDAGEMVIADELIFYLTLDDTSLNAETTDIKFMDNTGTEYAPYQRLNIPTGRKIKLPDPEPHGGQYWSYKDKDGKLTLYKKDNEVTVKNDFMEFHACGDQTLVVTYLYPLDAEDLLNGQEPGGIYETDNVKVGEYIVLKTSPGNIVEGCRFAGWESYDGAFEGIRNSGYMFRVMEEHDIEIVANYVEDADWQPDPGMGNENGTITQNGLTNSMTEELGKNAGIGVDVSLNNNPDDQSYGGTITKPGGTFTSFSENTTEKVVTNGSITSSTKLDSTLRSDSEDQYGRLISQDGDASKPLKQDDSLFGMDIYGNAFAYPYWAENEEERVAIVTERLRQYKGASWMSFINRHPELAAAVERFEKREMELLKDSCNDSLKTDRIAWRGWMDYYSDIPLRDNDTYVDQNNADGETNRLLSRSKFTFAWDNYTFYQYFYSTTPSLNATYDFNNVSGLTEEAETNLVILYNELIVAGYSEASACGVCSAVWVITNGTFNPRRSGEYGVGYGGWDASTAQELREICADEGLEWTTAQGQIKMLLYWLDENMDDVNSALLDDTSMMVKDFKKLNSESTAADICTTIFMEGDTTSSGEHDIRMSDGLYYEDAKDLRARAAELKAALKKTTNGYGFDMSSVDLSNCSEARKKVVKEALAQVGRPYIYGAKGPYAFDCSGLTSWAYRTVGIELHSKSYEQALDGVQVSRAMIRPGDLVVWRSRDGSSGHVAIYIGNNQMVEAMGRRYGILVSSLDRGTSKILLGYFSVLD